MPASVRASEPASDELSAVLVTGVYGAGKSTVVADVGALLESREDRYAVLDVDWLGWFGVGAGEEVVRQVTFANLRAVCRNYREAGVRRLALAWAVEDRTQLDGLRAAVGAPVSVVRLSVAEDVVRDRLGGDPTQARREDDLRVALDWLAQGRGLGPEDLVVPGVLPVREISTSVCAWLGWL